MTGKWWTLAAVGLGVFMLLLDITIVNVALPDIERSLGAGLSDLQWVIDAYALSLAAFLLTAGAIGDRVGRRIVFATGIVVFTLGSLLCGLAGDPTALALARVVQGVGGAIMFATSLALLSTSLPRAPTAASPSASSARSPASPSPSARCSAAPSPAASRGAGSSS